jgi:hypothetical protein
MLGKSILAVLNAGQKYYSGDGDRFMGFRALVAAAGPVLLAMASQASAHLAPPLIPTALVEDVKSATADVEFMDYVGSGQVIKLGPADVLVLSYLKSCEHETITGGTVVVGAERSDVKDGQITRAKVACDGGKVRLTAQQASKSAASAFRLQSADIEPTLYARTPVVQLPKSLASEDRTLLIERADHSGKRYQVKIDDAAVAAGFYDLAKIKLSLARGAIYDASIGSHKMTFQIDAKAKSGEAPIVSRLLRFQ